VLLSGGMDSAVTLYIARKTYDASALIFKYGQRAGQETASAVKVAEKAGVPYYILDISFPWKGSTLLDSSLTVPSGGASAGGSIPSTYVPGRNIIFLSFGVSFAEAIGARAVFIGAHEQDYSNYPDCRRGFFDNFEKAVNSGTKLGVEGERVEVVTPLIDKTKKEIIRTGMSLGVPFELTWSCYDGGKTPCGRCESCMFRARGFEEAGLTDPVLPGVAVKRKIKNIVKVVK